MLFLKFLHILNLHLNLDSWLNDSLILETFLIERLFDSWNLLWLNESLILETFFDWMTLSFLKLSWLLILDLSLWHHQNNLGKHCFHKSILARLGNPNASSTVSSRWECMHVHYYMSSRASFANVILVPHAYEKRKEHCIA